MKKLMVFLALLIALSLSACNMTISFAPKNTQGPAATQPQQPAAIPGTERSLIPPASTSEPPGGARGPMLQGGETVIRNDIFTINTRELTNTFDLPGNNAARLWRITAEMAPGQANRTLTVEAQVDRTQEVVQGGMAEGVSVGIYRLTSDLVIRGGETPDRVLTGNHPQNIDMNSSYVLYIRAVNSQTRPQNVRVRVTEWFELEISPPTARLLPGGSQAFRITRKGANIPPRVVNWSVEEGGAGGTVSNDGVYTAPNRAGTYHVLAVATEGPLTKSISATVTVSAATPTPTPTPTARPATGPGGAWVLKDTRTKLEQKPDEPPWDRYQVSGTGGSFTSRKDWKSRTDNRSGTVTSTSTISPAAPPPRLVPGTNLEFKLERTLNTGGEPNQGASVGINLYWEPGGGPDSSGSIGTPATATGSPSWATVWNWKVPPGRNAKMHVQFTYGGMSGSALTDYIYEWVE